jgi:hypothetical protein
LAGQVVSARLYPNQVCVATSDTIVASHVRITDRGDVRYDWQHYISLIERKPGALRNGAPFGDLPAPLQKLRHGLLRHPGGDRLMAQVLAAIPASGLDAVLVAAELVVESGVLSVEHVENVLARLHSTPQPPGAATALQLTEAPLADAARYDNLRELVQSEDDHA